MQSAVWQRSLNLELSRLLQAVAENPAAAGLSLLGFSFVYGVVHALGPGHGKIVITTWLATHPSKLKSSINLTLAASLLQGLVAIALVVVVLALLQLPARQLHLSSFWLEKGSYLLVGALGLLLCWRALKKLRLLLSRPTFTAFTPHHVHHEHCGCGHQHLPAPDQLQSGDDWRARAAIVLSMGMRPCSGAIMVLLFSKVIGGVQLGNGGGAGDGGGNLVDHHGAGAAGAQFSPAGGEVGSASGAAAVASGGLADAGAGRRRRFAGGGRSDVVHRSPGRRWDPPVLVRRRAQIRKWAPVLAAGEAML